MKESSKPTAAFISAIRGWLATIGKYRGNISALRLIYQFCGFSYFHTLNLAFLYWNSYHIMVPVHVFRLDLQDRGVDGSWSLEFGFIADLFRYLPSEQGLLLENSIYIYTYILIYLCPYLPPTCSLYRLSWIRSDFQGMRVFHRQLSIFQRYSHCSHGLTLE